MLRNYHLRRVARAVAFDVYCVSQASVASFLVLRCLGMAKQVGNPSWHPHHMIQCMTMYG